MIKPKQRIKILTVIVSAFLVFLIAQEFINMNQLKSEIKIAQEDNKKLIEEKEYLEKEVLKFNDEQYSQSYTMGVTFMTGDEQKIYMLPQPEEETPDN